MRCLLGFFIIITLSHSAPVQNEKEAEILQYEYNIDGKGIYNFSFKTSNGITRSEVGTVMDEGLPSQYILVEGRVVYQKPDGNEEAWTYAADRDGFHQMQISANLPEVGIPAALPSAVVASLLGK